MVDPRVYETHIGLKGVGEDNIGELIDRSEVWQVSEGGGEHA